MKKTAVIFSMALAFMMSSNFASAYGKYGPDSAECFSRSVRRRMKEVNQSGLLQNHA